MRLVVISHTGHYLNENQQPCGWIPTVRELDFLAQYFASVVHVAVLHEAKQSLPQGVAPYEASNVHFVPIPFYGGPGLKGKWSIFKNLPRILRTALKEVRQGDIFQFRAPTSIGVVLIPALTWFSRKKGWYKYAGNWVQPKKPLSYHLQKWLLQYAQKRPVTINGRWPGQPSHIFSFENPCLSEADRQAGQLALLQKRYDQGLTACFVGRLEMAKGVDRIIAAVHALYQKGVRTLHFVGDGPKREEYEQACQKSNVNCIFHGFLPRSKTFDIFRESHLNLLPSDSEGFPKVIAEGANFGCVPLVSAVSAIPQYVNGQNGFLWDVETDFTAFIAQCDFRAERIQVMSQSVVKIPEHFTLDHYWHQLQKYILI